LLGSEATSAVTGLNERLARSSDLPDIDPKSTFTAPGVKDKQSITLLKDINNI